MIDPEDVKSIDDGNITPLVNALGHASAVAARTRDASVRRYRRMEELTVQAERDAGELEELREALLNSEREVRRLRRENHETAQRAFYLQPGLRVRVGDHRGTTVEQPVMVPVMLDGCTVHGRFDAKFVHMIYTDPALGRDAGSIRMTRNAQDTPVGHAETTPRRDRPFGHEPGNPVDYLEALAEEVQYGVRQVNDVDTMIVDNTLEVRISFDVPPVRGQLSDLLYVAGA